MAPLTRRHFLGTAAAAAAAGVLTRRSPADQGPSPGRPVVIASANGLKAVETAGKQMLGGGDPLDAVIAGVNLVEEDPNDETVGYGGLPNEEGVVELDSSVMHGPSNGAGAVAALRNIVHPSRVARLVMQRTDHVLLVGEGALRFARAHGFEEKNLLTERARQAWLKWKENLSPDDDWISPEEEKSGHRQSRGLGAFTRHYGTINCCGVTADGQLAGVTTTSGLAFKIPGRVGDSPIIGAGLYVDNEVGAAGATGRGEAVIKICGAHTVVEAMRGGATPEEACLEAVRRIVRTTTDPRLLRPDGHPAFDVRLYAVSKNGRFGSASIWSGGQFAVFADGQARLADSAYLLERGR